MKSITDNLNLSLLEIFAVIFPGGAAIMLLLQIESIKDGINSVLPYSTEDWSLAIIFLGGAYFVGHVLFYFGSWLDDLIYDPNKILIYKPKTASVFLLRIAEKIEQSSIAKKLDIEGVRFLTKQVYELYADRKNWKPPAIQNEIGYTLYTCRTQEVKLPGNALKELVIKDQMLLIILQDELGGVEELQLDIPTGISMSWFERYDLAVMQHEIKNKSDYSLLSTSEKLKQALVKGETPLLNKALEYKKLETGSLDSDVINVFKWADARLMIHHPAMHNVIERHQTASKFFRSMILVFFFAMIVFLSKHNHAAFWIAVLLLAISLLNYFQQRYKAVRTAYEYIIVIKSKG